MIEGGFNRVAVRAIGDVDVVRPHVGRRCRIGNIVVFRYMHLPAADIGHPVMHAAFEQIDVAEELVDERRGRMVVHLVGCANLFDLAVVHDHHAVRHFQRLFLVVRDEHAGEIDLVVQTPQPAAQFLAHLGVERAEGLVQQQDLGFDRQRTGKGDALALAAGELVRIAVRQPVELHQLQQFHHAAFNFRLGRAHRARTHTQAECDVFENRHVPEQGVVLKHESDFTILHPGIGGVFIVEQDAPRVGLLEPGDDTQQRGLAGAGGAEQRDQFTGPDFEVDAVQCFESAEAFGNVLDLDGHELLPRCSMNDLIASVISARNASSDAQANAAAKAYSL